MPTVSGIIIGCGARHRHRSGRCSPARRPARFDRRRENGRRRRGRAGAAAAIDLGRCPYPWRQDRDFVEGAAERRSRQAYARRDRWRWLASPMCRTARSSAATPTVRCRRCARPAPGELYRHHLERLAWMDELVAHHGVRRALCAADLEAAHRGGRAGDRRRRRRAGLSRRQARAARGSASARHPAPAAGALHAQRYRRLPDRRDHPSRPDRIRRRGDPRLPPARLCLRRRARDRGHGEAGGQGRDQAAAAVAHGRCPDRARWGRRRSPAGRSAPITRARSPRPAARSASGTSSRASTNTSTGSRKWPTSSASIMSASAPTSMSTRAACVAGLHALGAPRRGDAARRLHRRGNGEDRRRQLSAHLPRRGRLRKTSVAVHGISCLRARFSAAASTG